MEKPIIKMAKSITGSNILNGKQKKNDVKFVSTDVLVSFLTPFSKYKKCISFIYNGLFTKTVSMFKIKTLKHCENLLKISNEIKQYVKK